MHDAGVLAPADEPLGPSSKAAPVVVVRASPAFRLVLEGTLARHAQVIWCAGDTELIARVRACNPHLVMLELGRGSSSQTLSLVRRIKALVADAPVLACTSIESAAADALRDAVRGGIDDLVLRDIETIEEIERVVLAAVSGGANDGHGWFASLAPSLHDISVPVAEHVVSHIRSGPNLDSVARALGCTTRTLQRWFDDAELGRPRRLIGLIRWLCVARVLASTSASVAAAARATGFATAEALRVALKRAMRITPLQLCDAARSRQLIRGILLGYGVEAFRVRDMAPSNEVMGSCAEKSQTDREVSRSVDLCDVKESVASDPG
jgi:AraC-like DNA-binding protein